MIQWYTITLQKGPRIIRSYLIVFHKYNCNGTMKFIKFIFFYYSGVRKRVAWWKKTTENYFSLNKLSSIYGFKYKTRTERTIKLKLQKKKLLLSSASLNKFHWICSSLYFVKFYIALFFRENFSLTQISMTMVKMTEQVKDTSWN